MEDHQNTLRVIVWFLVTCEIFALTSRLFLKREIMGTYGWDDALAVFAVLCSLAASIAADLAATQGLGRTNQPHAIDHSLRLLQKRAYVSEIFHILCLCAIKLSVLFLVKKLFSSRQSSKARARGINVCFGLITLWGVSSILVVAFQCRIPDTWDLAFGSCLDMTSFWIYFSVMDMIFDLTILILPSIMSWQLQLPLRKKAIIVSYFTPWLLATAVSAISIAYAHGFNDANQALPVTIGNDLWPWFICSQVLRAVTVVSACLPYLRQFIEAVPSGLFQADEIRRHGLTGLDIIHGYATSRPSANGSTVYYLRDTSTGSYGSSGRSIHKTISSKMTASGEGVKSQLKT